MSRKLHLLSAKQVNNATGPAKLRDGGNLYLYLTATGAKSWVFRYYKNGQERYMGLGPLRDVTLKEAREQASMYRKVKLSGKDPITHRNAEMLKNSDAVTFKESAEKYIESHGPSWKNAKHAAQWSSTLEKYAYPVIGDMPIGDIDTSSVLRVLEPIWRLKTETATRVRQRIEAVVDAATARGERSGENPARWKGHLAKLLPERSKVQRVKHHAAMPYSEVGDLIKQLREMNSISAKLLEFTILTASRTGEVVNARWAEFDLESKIWIIPPERMKAGREHRVALSDQAITLITGLPHVGGYVFPGLRHGKPISNAAMLKLLKKDLGHANLTVHGFRSAFRDWAAEVSSFPREVIEMALAHVIQDKTEAAYRRGDLFNKRILLMQSWADYMGSPIDNKGTVIPLQQINKHLPSSTLSGNS